MSERLTPPAEDAAAATSPAETPPPGGAAPAQAASPPAPEAAPAPAARPVIELRGLDLEVPGRTLLSGAELSVAPGELVLLVGPSGAGKSVLLRLLTGLLEGDDYTLRGVARVDGLDLLPGAGCAPAPARVRERVGLVFQDHALLDELTAEENLTFARDHAPGPSAGEACARALRFLEEHGIPPRARVRELSGGQKQRVAVARALARSPSVMFYDEPTSALDPRSARAVAELIRAAGERATTVVVTHDYAPFRGLATRLVLLDPARRSLREVSQEELEAFFREEVAGPPAAPPAPAGPLLPRLVAGVGRGLTEAAAATPRLTGALLGAIPQGLFPWRARPRWFLRWLLHYARIAFLGSALPYNLIAGVIAGFVATYFTYKFLPRPELSEPLVLDDVLPALGFALYRIVVPVLVTLLLAGRTGATLASDFGNRVYHHQTLAMRSLGAPASSYLGTASLWANLVGVLVVAAAAFWAATLTSLGVFLAIQPDLTPFYWQAHYWRRLEPFSWGLIGDGWGWVLGKLLVSAAGVHAVSWAFGLRPKRSTADVSRGITLSVYWGTVFVLLVHFVAAFYEFERLREWTGGR